VAGAHRTPINAGLIAAGLNLRATKGERVFPIVRMKFLKSVIAFVTCFCLSLPVQSQPLEKTAEPELPALSVAQLSQMVGGPTKVSLHYDNADFDAALKDVSTKFDVPFAFSARTGPKGPLTLDLHDAHLWTVWEALRGQVQYDRKAPSIAPRGSLLLTPTLAERTYSTYDTSLFQVRTLGMRTNDKNWTMTLAVVADPKIEIAPSSGRVHLTEAIDDEGHNLLSDDVHASFLYPTMSSVYYSSVSQNRPEKVGKRLVRLRGVITAYAILKREPWEVTLTDVPAEKTAVRDGVTEVINVANVQRDEKDHYSVELSRALKSLINYRFWDSRQTRLNSVYNYALFSSVQLQDAQGRKFYLHHTNVDADYDNEIYLYTWTGRFERAPENQADAILPEGEPTKLIMNLPLEVQRFELPFELTDVPIN
jgi:hypothetical protein